MLKAGYSEKEAKRVTTLLTKKAGFARGLHGMRSSNVVTALASVVFMVMSRRCKCSQSLQNPLIKEYSDP